MEQQEGIKLLIKQYHPVWNQVDTKDILLERMTGITNQTYKATPQNHPLNPIIFRKFGQATENIFLQRQSETFVYNHIYQQGLGPQIFYYDQKIRIEEFIYSSVLPVSKMLSPGYLQEVAFALSKFHRMKPASQSIKCESLIQRVFFDREDTILSICHNKLNKDIYLPGQKQLVEVFKQWVSHQQIEYIKKIVKQFDSLQLVFSHNDTLANNILIKNTNGEVVLIDYEYSCYNYPIFDIANYFIETEYDYDVKEPPYFGVIPSTQQKQLMKERFLEAYIVAKYHKHEQFKAKFEDFRKEQRYQEQKNILMRQLPIGQMLANLMWGWWGIIVCKNPQINFDYLAFVKKRFEDYQIIKKTLNI